MFDRSRRWCQRKLYVGVGGCLGFPMISKITSLGRLKRVCGNTFVCGDGGGSLWCVLVFDQSPPGYLG